MDFKKVFFTLIIFSIIISFLCNRSWEENSTFCECNNVSSKKILEDSIISIKYEGKYTHPSLDSSEPRLIYYLISYKYIYEGNIIYNEFKIYPSCNLELLKLIDDNKKEEILVLVNELDTNNSCVIVRE